MSLFSRLFGKKPDQTPSPRSDSEEYKGFVITPTPISEGGQYRVSARIEKDGHSHDLIRADTIASPEQAVAISLAKARQLIDEQGDRMFAPR